MNVLIHTPLLKSTTLKTDFDNKIILGFLLLIITLMFLGLIFIDLIKARTNPFPVEEENPQSFPVTITT